MSAEEIKVISFSVNLKQIPEEKIVKVNANGEPFKNKGEFVNLTMFLNDKEDQYGNNVSIIISKDKNSDEETTYVGKGKYFK